MLDLQRLSTVAASYSLSLSPAQLQGLDTYASLLVDWNTRMNLTAITQPEEIETKHMLDCLLLAAQPEVQGSLVDVGSGAGFPGMVVKLFKPEVKVTLIEPTGKRVEFLRHVAAELGIQVDVVKERAEEAARKVWRESFGVATARAVAAMPLLAEYCLPLIEKGGVFLAMKGDVNAEMEDSVGALAKLGGTLREVRQYQLPDTSARSIVVVDKTGETPAPYPRNGGVISKRPLWRV